MFKTQFDITQHSQIHSKILIKVKVTAKVMKRFQIQDIKSAKVTKQKFETILMSDFQTFLG